MKSSLNIEDIQIISNLMSEKINELDERNKERFEAIDNSFGLRIKSFQLVNEENHERVYLKVCNVEDDVKLIHDKQDLTNGRVAKHESLIFGNKELNEPGILQIHKEIKKYRPYFKNIWVVLFSLFVLIPLAIPETREFMMNLLKLIKIFK